MELKFSKTDLGSLVRGDWELVCGPWKKDGAGIAGRWLTIEEDGLCLTKTENQEQPWVHPGREGLVLPLPTFTLAQFRSFCDWHPTFGWEAIESVFTNDDGTLDEDALKELASRGEAAAVLVRGVLLPHGDDYMRAWETHCEIDECRAEIAELKSLRPTTITERAIAKQELEKLGTRLTALLKPDAEPDTAVSPEPAATAPQQPEPAAMEAFPGQLQAVQAKPIQRGAAQDAAILDVIRYAGHDPLALPVNEPGKPGIKAEVRASLAGNTLFVGMTVFEKAWERLRQRGDIADRA